MGTGAPEQAAEACAFADGVVVGSALMVAVSQGSRERALELASMFRGAIRPIT